MSPHETLFRLEGTSEVEKMTVDNNAVSQFVVWDFPGDYYSTGGGADNGSSPPLSDSEVFGGSPCCIIYVLDAQDEPYDLVLSDLTSLVHRAGEWVKNGTCWVHVFINKVDGELFLSEEAKYDCRRDVVSLVQEEMESFNSDLSSLDVHYYLTSIYDHSVFSSFSKVAQKLVPALPTISSLMNVLVDRCGMEKAFLFDVASKLYIATDSRPVDAAGYELCSDMIDVVLDVSGIYGTTEEHAQQAADDHGRTTDPDKPRGAGGGDADADVKPNPDSSDPGAVATPHGPDFGYYDSGSTASIHLSSGLVLHLAAVSSMLALACLARDESFERRGVVDYNIGVFKEAMGRIIRVTRGGR